MIELTALRTAIAAAITLLLAAVLFGAGWTIKGWKDEAEIAGLKTEQANTAAAQANAALTDLTTATTTINEAARRYGSVQSSLSAQIDDLKKELQNEKPLPDGCSPDGKRSSTLNKAIDATNAAAKKK